MSRRLDAWLALALVGLAAALWLWLVPTYAGEGGQAIMPRLAAALIGGLSLLLLGAAFLRGPEAGHAPADDDPFLETDGGEPWRIWLLFLVWGIVLVFARHIGLQLGTALAIALSFVILGVRRPFTIVTWSVLPVAAMHVIFEYGFALRLPRGEIVRLVLG